MLVIYVIFHVIYNGCLYPPQTWPIVFSIVFGLWFLFMQCYMLSTVGDLVLPQFSKTSLTSLLCLDVVFGMWLLSM